MPAFTLGAYQACLAQHNQVLRDDRLPDPGDSLDMADTSPVLCQDQDNEKADGLPQDAENFSQRVGRIGYIHQSECIIYIHA